MKTTINFRRAILAAACIALMTAPAYATPKPETAGDINNTPVLIEIEQRTFDKLLQTENATLNNAKTVYIEAVPVTFDKRWIRNHRTDVTEKYKERTKERYGKLMHERLVHALEKDGTFTVVDKVEDADVVLAPEIDNLNILGPDDGFKKTYVYTAGYAALDLDIYDAKTNTLVAEIYDRRETRNADLTGTQLATRVTNYRDFKHLMDRWAKRVTEHLVELNTK